MYAVYVAAINGYKLEAGGHWKLAAMNSSTWFGAEGCDGGHDKFPIGGHENSPDMANKSPQIWPRNSPDMATEFPRNPTLGLFFGV